MMFSLLQIFQTTTARRTLSSSAITTTASTTTAAFATTSRTTARECRTHLVLSNANILVNHQHPPKHNPQHPHSTVSSTRLYSSTLQSYEEEDMLLESGYHRPPVQWYPGHIAKAERQLSETLKAVDVVVEVRDARACKATAHPRVGEWCAGRPRIVVLTHLDMTPKSAVKAWQNAYENLGAERWDDAPINAQVANQANQARQIRFQYSSEENGKANKKQQQQQSQKGKSTTTTSKNSDKTVTPVEQVLFVNAKQGEGIHMLTRSIFKAGSHVQERRERRGLNPRPLRVGIIGYPNVGKVCMYTMNNAR